MRFIVAIGLIVTFHLAVNGTTLQDLLATSPSAVNLDDVTEVQPTTIDNLFTIITSPTGRVWNCAGLNGWVIHNSTVVIEGVHFSSCAAVSGSAILAVNSTITLKNCIFSNNSAEAAGAGIAARAYSSIVATKTIFTNNTLTQAPTATIAIGAGVQLDAHSRFSGDTCSFINNQLTASFRTTDFAGGAAIGSQSPYVNCSFCLFQGNFVQSLATPSSGGAVHMLSHLDHTYPELEVHSVFNNCTFDGNYMESFQEGVIQGGAFCVSTSYGVTLQGPAHYISIPGTVFRNNYVTASLFQSLTIVGGAFMLQSSVPLSSSEMNPLVQLSVTDTLFLNNSAFVPATSDQGGGFIGAQGGAMHILNSNPMTQVLFQNVRFESNLASVSMYQVNHAYGGAISIDSSAQNSGGYFYFSNVDFIENQATGSGISVNAFGGCLYMQGNAVSSGGGAVSYLDVESSNFVGNSLVSGIWSPVISYQDGETSGGALYLLGAVQLSLYNTIFERNFVQAQMKNAAGGAVRLYFNFKNDLMASLVDVDHCTFRNNYVQSLANYSETLAVLGGAFSVETQIGTIGQTSNVRLTVRNSAFIANQALAPSYVNIQSGGGALAFVTNGGADSSALIISNSNFTGNAAMSSGTSSGGNAGGGAIYISASSLSLNEPDGYTISSCQFHENAAIATSPSGIASGGAITMNTNDPAGSVPTTLALSFSVFTSNIVKTTAGSSYGGALQISAATRFASSLDSKMFTVLACHFTNNSALGFGSEIADGGAVAAMASIVDFNFCYFTGNLALRAGAITYIGTVSSIEFSYFENNYALQEGGALFLLYGSVSLTQSNFVGNTANVLGGAIFSFLTYDPGLLVKECLFDSNQANSGGAIYTSTVSDATLQKTTFVNNQAVFAGGAGYITGSLHLSACNVTANSAGTDGAGFSISQSAIVLDSIFAKNVAVGDGGGLTMVQDGSVEVQRTTFDSNRCLGNGGALSGVDRSQVTMIQVALTNNSATGFGGAIASTEMSTLYISVANVTGNSAVKGGGIYSDYFFTGELIIATGNTASEAGGAMRFGGSFPLLYDAVVSYNTAEFGAGLYAANAAQLTLLNSSVHANHALTYGGGVLFDTTMPNLTLCEVDDNIAPFGPDLASIPVRLDLVAVDQLYGDSRTCTGPVMNPWGQPVVPSGCNVVLDVVFRDVFGQVAIAPVDIAVSLGPSCGENGLCAAGISSQTMGLNGVRYNVTITGEVGSSFCLVLATQNPPFNCVSNPFEGTIGACGVGKFSPLPGTCDGCRDCPDGLFDVSGTGECQSCAQDGESCVGCEPATVGCASGYIWSRENYYLLYDNSTALVAAIPCASSNCQDVCPMNITGQACSQILASSQESYAYSCVPQRGDGSIEVTGYCHLHSKCEFGRDGFLCGACMPGYSEWNDVCVDCSKPNHGIAAALVIANWAYVIIVHAMLSGRVSAMTKILIYYTQVSVFILGPDAVATWAQIFLSIFRLPEGGGQCLFERSFYGKFVQSLLMPFVSLAQLLIFIGVVSVVRAIRGQPRLESRRWILRPILSLIFANYTPVSSAVMDILNCQEVVAGSFVEHIIVSSPGLRCSGSVYDSYSVLAVMLAVIVVAGLPVAVSVMLWRRRHHRYDASASRFGYLFECYRPETFWWEVVVLLRRTLLTVLTLINISDIRSFTLGLMCCVIFAVQLVFRPLRTQMENSVELIALATISFLAMAHASEMFLKRTSIMVWVLTAVLAIPLIIIFLAVVYMTWDTTMRVYRRIRSFFRHIRGVPDDDYDSVDESHVSQMKHVSSNPSINTTFDGVYDTPATTPAKETTSLLLSSSTHATV